MEFVASSDSNNVRPSPSSPSWETQNFRAEDAFWSAMRSIQLGYLVRACSYEVFKGSYKPTTVVALAEEETNTEVKPPLEIGSLGAFQKLPMVMQSADILSSALRKARKVSPTKGIANISKMERNRGANQLDALMKELAAPLKICLEKFPDKKGLHPYESSLVELTLRNGNYEEVIKKLILRGRRWYLLERNMHLFVLREAGQRLNHVEAVDELINIAKGLVENSLVKKSKKDETEMINSRIRRLHVEPHKFGASVLVGTWLN